MNAARCPWFLLLVSSLVWAQACSSDDDSASMDLHSTGGSGDAGEADDGGAASATEAGTGGSHESSAGAAGVGLASGGRSGTSGDAPGSVGASGLDGAGGALTAGSAAGGAGAFSSEPSGGAAGSGGTSGVATDAGEGSGALGSQPNAGAAGDPRASSANCINYSQRPEADRGGIWDAGANAECSCDVIALCAIAMSEFCPSPAELGCPPTLERARRVPWLGCGEFHLAECDDGTTRLGWDNLSLFFRSDTGVGVRHEIWGELASSCGPGSEDLLTGYMTPDSDQMDPFALCRDCKYPGLDEEPERRCAIDEAGRVLLPD